MDLYETGKKLEQQLKRISDSSEISQVNKELILKFKDRCFAEGLSNMRVLIYMVRLEHLARWLNKDFATASKDDIRMLVGRIEQNPKQKPNTKRMYKVTLKKLYKTMFGDGEFYPEQVRGMNTTLKTTDQLLPEELLTKDEINKMIDAGENPRDKAFVVVLAESGCRVSEITRLAIKHVSFDDIGAQIVVSGKTGPRRVRLIWSIHYLTYWLENHPFKANPDSPLWIRLTTKGRGQQLLYVHVRLMLLRLAKKAGITKSVRPHMFRHARSTELAKLGLNQPQMEAYLGWRHGSDMPATYLHLSGKDVDDALLSVYGIKKKEGEDNRLKCPRCFRMNEVTARYCACGMPLNLRAAVEAEADRQKFDEKITVLMELLAKDADVREYIASKLGTKPPAT
ncbi:MAG: tyrosine-type recombinase/integrase [Candidatus Micrarchaeota archaeon]